MKQTMQIIIKNDTRPNSPHRAILDLIPYGIDNAVTTQYIADRLNAERRQVRHMVEYARIDGNIIAGTNEGLFIPETDAELRGYVTRAYSHIKGTVQSLNPAYHKCYGKDLHIINGGDNND